MWTAHDLPSGFGSSESIHTAGHLLNNRPHIIIGHKIRRAGVLGANEAAAVVHHLDHVWPDRRDQNQCIIFAREPEGIHQNDRGRADNIPSMVNRKRTLLALKLSIANFTIPLNIIVELALCKVLSNEDDLDF